MSISKGIDVNGSYMTSWISFKSFSVSLCNSSTLIKLIIMISIALAIKKGYWKPVNKAQLRLSFCFRRCFDSSKLVKTEWFIIKGEWAVFIKIYIERLCYIVMDYYHYITKMLSMKLKFKFVRIAYVCMCSLVIIPCITWLPYDIIVLYYHRFKVLVYHTIPVIRKGIYQLVKKLYVHTQSSVCMCMHVLDMHMHAYIHIPYSGKLWRQENLANSQKSTFGGRKFGDFITSR